MTREYAIGVRWIWGWETVTMTASATYQAEGNPQTFTSSSEPFVLYVPRITGDAVVYYGDKVWRQKVTIVLDGPPSPL